MTERPIHDFEAQASEQQSHAANLVTAAPLLATNKNTTAIQSWPTAPRRIRSPWWIIVWNVVFDLLLFACAVAFLAFAGIVSHYDQASTAENPRTTAMLLNATRYVSQLSLLLETYTKYPQGPTVFPILFALVLGRTTHTILRWRLESGERIGVLDTLAASTSFTSTLVSQFQLRAISLCGIVLMCIWALSPVGGQASLRQMVLGMKTTTQMASFEYLIHHGYMRPFGAVGSSRDSIKEIANTIFTGGIIGSLASRSSPVDTWGNVKIPRIEYYESKGEPDREGWFKTANGSSDSYSSMIGIPVSGTNSTHFVNYKTTIQTPYFNTACLITLRPSEQPPVIPNGTFHINGTGAVVTYENATQMRRSSSDPETLGPLQFRYSTLLWSLNNHDLDCKLSSSYVETEITCPERTTCMATEVRRSKLGHPRTDWTQFDLHWETPSQFFLYLFSSVSGRYGWPTMLDRYMSDPDTLITLDQAFGERVGSALVLTSEENYSVRLAQLMNSYWTIVGGMYTIAGGISNSTSYKDNITSFVPPENPRGAGIWYQFSSPVNLTGKTWSSQGTKDVRIEVIIARKPWVITLCISSIVLILASLVSPVVYFLFIRGPEVMMNISSLATRHNPYIPLPEGGTHLGASDRARLLKGLELRFGDVETGSGVGHLAIGIVGGKGDEEIARIHKGKLYE
jgi:hypothetical protein